MCLKVLNYKSKAYNFRCLLCVLEAVTVLNKNCTGYLGFLSLFDSKLYGPSPSYFYFDKYIVVKRRWNKYGYEEIVCIGGVSSNQLSVTSDKRLSLAEFRDE